MHASKHWRWMFHWEENIECDQLILKTKCAAISLNVDFRVWRRAIGTKFYLLETYRVCVSKICKILLLNLECINNSQIFLRNKSKLVITRLRIQKWSRFSLVSNKCNLNLQEKFLKCQRSKLIKLSELSQNFQSCELK